MMILKNLFSKVVVDAFVTEPRIKDLFPIEKSVKLMPKWFKELPLHFMNHNEVHNVTHPAATIKTCPAIIGMFKESFSIPLWTDLIIRIDENRDWHWMSSGELKIESHTRLQYGNCFNYFTHFKLVSPWLLKTKSNINFSWQEAKWNTVADWPSLNIVPGLTEFKYQRATNINMFINNGITELKLYAGTPLVMLIPLTEKKVELRSHLVTDNEWNMIFRESMINCFWTRGYQKIRSIYEKKGL